MPRELTCGCGSVRLALEQAPIIVAECHCSSCRTAAQRLEALPVRPSILEDNGGTQFVLYRKDRVQFLSGTEHLAAFRLKPDSPTRRVIATCCNTPICLEFKGGHWLSLYGHLWPDGTMPPLQLRTVTKDRPEDAAALDSAVPDGGWATTKFYGSLLGAWIAMGFRVPNLEVPGRIELPQQARP
jgi:hypothetical protein